MRLCFNAIKMTSVLLRQDNIDVFNNETDFISIVQEPILADGASIIDMDHSLHEYGHAILFLQGYYLVIEYERNNNRSCDITYTSFAFRYEAFKHLNLPEETVELETEASGPMEDI